MNDSLAWLDPFLSPWFSLLGAPVSELEAVAFVLSIAMVLCNLRVSVIAWPLAIVSSVLYGLLFARSRLYGEASLQIVFVALSVWGWWRWARDPHGRDESAGVRALPVRTGWQAVMLAAIAWPVLGYLLGRWTDSDVPYADAFPTAGSLLGQWLLGRKYVANWLCWVVVNLVSVLLFAWKGLWLTVVLYLVFVVLSLAGWRAWRKRLGASA